VLDILVEHAIGAEQIRNVVNPLRLLVAMLLTLGLLFVFLFVRQTWIEIDLGKFADQIRQYERVWIVRIQKSPALLGKIRFVRFFIDREKQLLFQQEQFFLARVGVERKLGFIDRAPL